MAILKIVRHTRQYGLRSSVKKTLQVLPHYLRTLYLWRIRRCACCHHMTVFLSNGPASETRACLFCSANERYELLAAEIEKRFGKSLREKDVLELDPHSPLRRTLSRSRSYAHSFYEVGTGRGAARADGAINEDITSLSFSDGSLDLIVSSDVLEHVPSLEKAFSETARVLRPGGVHLFTVPPRSKTRKRSEIVDGGVRHIEIPEYHRDPLSLEGILSFWDIGPDLPEVISSPTLDIRVARGPVGDDGRIVWIAERRG
jgi:SAM-dependent methyltransferase